MSPPFLIQTWFTASTKSNTEIPLYCIGHLPTTHMPQTSPVLRPPLASWYLPRYMKILLCLSSLKTEQSFQLLLQKMQGTKLIDDCKIKKKVQRRKTALSFLLYLLYFFFQIISQQYFLNISYIRYPNNDWKLFISQLSHHKGMLYENTVININ